MPTNVRFIRHLRWRQDRRGVASLLSRRATNEPWSRTITSVTSGEAARSMRPKHPSCHAAVIVHHNGGRKYALVGGGASSRRGCQATAAPAHRNVALPQLGQRLEAGRLELKLLEASLGLGQEILGQRLLRREDFEQPSERAVEAAARPQDAVRQCGDGVRMSTQ